MAEDFKQENHGPAFTQVGDHNQQHVHLHGSQAAQQQTMQAVQAAIRTFLRRLQGLKDTRQRLTLQEDGAESYAAEVERVTRPLVEALVQGVLTLPDERLSPELEGLIESVLEEEDLTTFYAGRRDNNWRVYPLYLLCLGVLGAGVVDGRVNGIRGLLTPQIEWAGQTVPWLILVILINPLAERLDGEPLHLDVTRLSRRVGPLLFGEQAWIHAALPAASREKYFTRTEAMLAMLVYGAQERRYVDPGDIRYQALLGEYIYQPQVRPLLAERARALDAAGVALSWLPQGFTALYGRYLKFAEPRFQGW